MVVNREGDLELYAVHDTPKQAVWSARGDLAIGAGQSYRIIPGFNEDEPPPEPWDVQTNSQYQFKPELISRSRSGQPREESIARTRGRSKPGTFPSAPMFGRGDEDGFPALNTSSSVIPGQGHGQTNLAATRPGKSRTYSPARLRNYHHHFEPSRNSGDYNHSPARPGIEANGLTSRGRSHHSHDEKSTSRGRKQVLKAINRIVEDDISMVMRQRAIRGYSLGNVRPLHSLHC